MKKSFLLRLGALAMFVGSAAIAGAQPTDAARAILGARLTVDAPTGINHPIKFSYSTQVATNTWGAPINSPIVHQVVVKPTTDSLGCIGSMSSNVSGKWVLIYRGNCQFGSKALHAQQAGATGVIVWDHTPNEPLVNMDGGDDGGNVHIPVLFISHEDGMALAGEIHANDSAHVTLTKWGFGASSDLALVTQSEALPHALALPSYQLDGTDVPQYRVYSGAFVCNTGTSTQTNVKVHNTINWTPTGGSSSVVYKDSVVVPQITTADSININMFSPRTYTLAPTGTGSYTFNYNVTSDSVDAVPGDNAESVTMNVTSNVYCKGGFNVTTQEPVVAAHYAVTSSGATQASAWGPIFYMHKGGYGVTTLKFGALPVDTGIHYISQADQDGKLALYIFKWKDDNNDGFMTTDELSMAGTAVKQFATTDSADGRTVYTAYVKSPDGSSTPVVTEAGAYYWVVGDILTEYQIGGDGTVNFYNRTRAGQDFATNKFDDYWAPRFDGDVSSIDTTNGSFIVQVPFGFKTGATNAATHFADSASYLQNAGTPNIAMFTTTYPVKVENVTNKSADALNVYPNPASNQIIADVKLVKASAINLRVVNAIGQTVYMESHKDVTNGKFTVDLSKLSAGNYYMVMINGEQAITRPFTVAK